jgi:catechol 2,3-dioxygenase-like lactoylglutathione lyase family enzyme
MTGKLMPGIHHSAICTADLDRSMKFWRDGLGFTQLHVKQSRSLQVSLV